MGHVVEVATLDSAKEVASLRYPMPLHCLGPAHSSWRFAPALLPWLRSNRTRFDVVVVEGLWQYHGFAAHRVLDKSNTPYFVFPHGMLDPWFKRAHPFKHAKKWLFWPWSEYRLLRDARAVLFTCDRERVLASQSFWLYRVVERLVAFGGADPPADLGHAKHVFLEAFPELQSRRFVLYLGRIHGKKGCDLLIEAFARIATEYPDIDLVMAGPGDERLIDQLQRRATALGVGVRIHWPGMLQGELKWGALRASEVFALPSHQENFGIAVAEALACGVPVLISDKVNICNEVLEGGAGFVAADDVDGTLHNLRRWLELPAERAAAMKRAAVATYEAHFTVQAMADSLVGVIQSATTRDIRTARASGGRRLSNQPAGPEQ